MRVFLEEADLHPHRSRYWLNPKVNDVERHAAEVAEVCEVYRQAQALASVGTHVVSTDEKTGIQALERLYPDIAMGPGRVQKREFEYIRHQRDPPAHAIGDLAQLTGREAGPRGAS